MTDVSPLSVGMNPYPIPTQESCQCIPADFQFPRHLRLTGSRLQHSLNFFFFSRKFIFRVMSSPWDVPALSEAIHQYKSLTGTLGNQVTILFVQRGKKRMPMLRLYISQFIFLFHREQDDDVPTYMHSVYPLPSINLSLRAGDLDTINVSLSLFFSIVRQAFCLWLTIHS